MQNEWHCKVHSNVQSMQGAWSTRTRPPMTLVSISILAMNIVVNSWVSRLCCAICYAMQASTMSPSFPCLCLQKVFEMELQPLVYLPYVPMVSGCLVLFLLENLHGVLSHTQTILLSPMLISKCIETYYFSLKADEESSNAGDPGRETGQTHQSSGSAPVLGWPHPPPALCPGH